MWKGIDYLPVLASEKALACFEAGANTCWMVLAIFAPFDEGMQNLISLVAALKLALQCCSNSSLLNINHHFHVVSQVYE